MPAGDSVVNVLVRIGVEAQGRGLGSTLNAYRALSVGAKKAEESVGGLNQAVTESGRGLFRYTFYALWFSRVVQGYLGLRLARGFMAAAEAADAASVRLQALSGATAAQMASIRQFADELSTRVPFAFSEITKGLETGVRAGVGLAEAMKLVQTATGLALAEGTSLAEATEFLSQVMFSFGLSAEGAARALDQIFVAAKASPYSFAQMTYALRMTMASASALGQSLESLLALISIFGKAGVPAAQAATMINQAFTRIGDPETLAFIENVLAWGATIPEVLERVGGAMPVLFDMQKGLQDVGEALIGAAQTIAYLREQAAAEGWLGEFDRQLMQVLYRVFGIRNLRAFLTLANVSLEEYRALRERIAEASGAVEQYTQTLYASWETTRSLAKNAFDNIKRLIGGGMIALFNVPVRFFAELANGIFLIGRQVPLLTDFIGAMAGVITVIGGAAAALSSFVIVLTLLHGKLKDVGTYIMKEPALWTQIQPKVPPGAGPYEVGKYYVLGRFVPGLRLLGSLAFAVSLAFVAWRNNLAGIQDRLPFLRDAFRKIREEAGGIAGAISDWFKAAREKPRSPLQAFVGGMFKIFEGTLRFWGSALAKVIEHAVKLLSWGARALSSAVRFLFTPLAWIVGLGDTLRGFERLGKGLQIVISAFMTLWMAKKFFELGGWFLRGVRALIFGTQILGRWHWPGLFGGLRNLARPVLSAIGALVRGLIGAGRLIRAVGFERAIITTLKTIATGFKILLFEPIMNMLRKLFAFIMAKMAALLLGRGVGLIGNVLGALLPGLAGLAGGLLKGIGGALAGLGGGLVKGIGGVLGSLGAFLAPVLPHLAWAVPLLAALGGLGYGIYRLVTRPKAAEAPTPYRPEGLTQPLAPAYVTNQITISPTIMVPEGTTAEQAQAIMNQLEPQIIALFDRLSWQRTIDNFEWASRAGLLTGIE